ncbi:alpha/beta hydrolase [Peptacetobacter hominis]|uniref:Alpha/beta hydrolase n=1 Tax=Peptacetobacter hominis TaxID=2743610 RepID=A0A544QWB2_9FIRM|nr:alpha/beta hydrolase [Peptacetobacter hominis]TQQ84971.1 alpha/beta hydrolase [Peptacetobacter hominis]
MDIREFTFEGADKKPIFARRWESKTDMPTKGVIQIAHGMTETGKRYERFAKFLTERGYIVYINDHRGHGETEQDMEGLGFFAENEGFDLLVKDMKILTDIIKKENQGLPVYLFGHSMGSFASQKYLIDYPDEVRAVVLAGSNGDFGPLIKLALPLLHVIEKIKGARYRSAFIENAVFGANNKKFKEKRTKYDWLSRDEEEVDKYIKDEKCGFMCTVEFYRDFVKGLIYIESDKNLKKLSKSVPIMIISGDADPIGKNGEGVKNLYRRYKKYGVKDVTMKLYPDARHELLNEINRDEIMYDIVRWFNSK